MAQIVRNQPRYFVAVVAALLCWAGCSVGPFGAEIPPAVPAIIPQGVTPATERFLYAGGGHKLSQYALGSSEPRRTTKFSNYVQSVALALDSRRDYLYEQNGDPSYEQILVYDARNLKLERTLGFGPASLAIDRLGYLYAADESPIYVFAPGGTRLVQVIHRGASSAKAMVFDRSGNLYAGNLLGRSVSVYAPAATPGDMTFIRSIHQGVDNPNALTFGPSGDLFVLNWPYPKSGSVSVYAPGGSKPERRITSGVDGPRALAVDSRGRLYVANVQPNSYASWVSVYPPGRTRPIRKITDGIKVPLALAIDLSDNLYVANTNGRSVTVYSASGAKLVQTITEGIGDPTALVIGLP